MDALVEQIGRTDRVAADALVGPSAPWSTTMVVPQ